jgi:hypothetical protein
VQTLQALVCRLSSSTLAAPRWIASPSWPRVTPVQLHTVAAAGQSPTDSAWVSPNSTPVRAKRQSCQGQTRTRSRTACWMTRSGYPESAARELTLLCADRTRQSFELPREASLCNAHLPEATRRAIEACLGPGCAGVW